MVDDRPGCSQPFEFYPPEGGSFWAVCGESEVDGRVVLCADCGGREGTTPRGPAYGEGAGLSLTPGREGSYTKGVNCGRGNHAWEDRGGYWKCSKCNSTKTKPKGGAA